VCDFLRRKQLATTVASIGDRREFGGYHRHRAAVAIYRGPQPPERLSNLLSASIALILCLARAARRMTKARNCSTCNYKMSGPNTVACPRATSERGSAQSIGRTSTGLFKLTCSSRRPGRCALVMVVRLFVHHEGLAARLAEVLTQTVPCRGRCGGIVLLPWCCATLSWCCAMLSW
jgi:hypothetical protein